MKKASHNNLLQTIARNTHVIMEGETQVELAKKLNVSQGNVAKYLQGKIVPRADVLYHMILSKNINPVWFLTGEGHKELGAGHDISKPPKASKVSKATKLPQELDKELKRLDGRLENIARQSPESLKMVKIFLSALENTVNPRKKR